MSAGLGIENVITTMSHQHTTGQVERYNCTIIPELRSYVKKHPEVGTNMRTFLLSYTPISYIESEVISGFS